MIIEAIFDILLGIVKFFIDSFMALASLPVGDKILFLPSPLFPLFQHIGERIAQYYPIVFAYYIFRQVKA